MRKMLSVFIPVLLCVAMMSVFSARQAAAEEPVTMEEAFGFTLGISLYNVQIVLGISADAFAKDVYTADEMTTIINEQISMLDNLGKYLNKLAALKTVSAADKSSMKEGSGCVDKLTATANALSAYVADPSQDNADVYQTKRKASYAAISVLLGLDESK
jgi:hypothetical protein